MKASRLDLPFMYKVANVLGKPLSAAGLPAMRLNEAAVTASAMKQTGLTDFGDSYYREGLLPLLESADNEADLHPLGRFMANDIITNYLAQRLWLVETRKKEPELFQEPLLPPLIICGLARSGTTFLHNMLALDPTHRALPLWLLTRPFPERAGSDDSPDPRLVKMEQSTRFRLPLLPGIDSIHYQRADSPEECIVALGLTFNSLVFPVALPVPSYMDWYLQQEGPFEKYREYGWLLQIFQSRKPEQRLTLKAPAHTGNLEWLLQAIPEALLIQTHRDPVACVSSVCSLIHTYHLAVAKEVDVPRMASFALDMYELWFRRNLAFRKAHPGMIFDVFFDTLVSDPVGTLRGIYAHFDLPWSDAYTTALEEYIQSQPKNKHGKHQYAAEDFGLTNAEIDERLGFYSEYFELNPDRKLIFAG